MNPEHAVPRIGRLTHGVLDRQLEKRGLGTTRCPRSLQTWTELLDTIARTYTEADQGRELLERSLAISSDEMQELYTRQRAISACAQALLLHPDDEAVPATLREIVKSAGAVCAWIETVGPGDDRAHRHREWTTCEHDEDSGPATAAGDRPTADGDGTGTLPTAPASGSSVLSHGVGGSHVVTRLPIVGQEGKIGDLCVATGQPVARGDAEVFRMAAGMLGSFLDRLESHRRLAEHQRALEALIRSKDQLIASIAHEIRTPMTAIMGYAHLLRDNLGTIADENRAFMSSLVEQGEELTNIVDDLVVAARADLGRLSFVAVNVNLLAQTRQVLEAMTSIPADSITVEGAAVHAAGDPVRVRQIIRNLVTNASRYGGPTLTIGVEADAKYAHLIVTDNGDGVPDVMQDRIFDAYFRVHDTPGLTHSLGLGLNLSRTLARLMGGDLTYRRVEAHTIFDLALPRAGS